MRQEPSFEIGSGWRVRGIALARFVIFLGCFVVLNLALNALLAGIQRRLSILEEHMLLAMASLCVAVVVLTAIMAKTESRQLADFGLNRARCVVNFALGLACGFVGLSLQLALLALVGDVFRPEVSPINAGLLTECALLTALFLIGAVTEEFLFRGYTLVKLAQVISFWPAAILLSALFGAFHGLKGGGENLSGGVQAFAVGLAFAYSFRLTGTLWLAIGSHFGWNFAQSFIFGLPNSAVMFSNSLSHTLLHGSQLWTGGTVGPEGSVLFFIFPCFVVLVSWLRRSRPQAALP